jgi:hypothetical protein
MPSQSTQGRDPARLFGPSGGEEESERCWTIWHESPSLRFRVPSDLPCHEEAVGLLNVIEQRRDDVKRPYGIRIEAEVRNQFELSHRKREVVDLAADLRKAWPYVAGVPFLTQEGTLQVSLDGPVGWRTNLGEIKEEVPGDRIVMTVGAVQGGGPLEVPFMLLEPVLRARERFLATDDITLTLREIHLDALGERMRGGDPFRFAKALELATALLPGHSAKQKQTELKSDYAKLLTRPLGWLGDIANNRIDVRHVVRKSKGNPTSAHSKLSREERQEFIQNADLVVRGVIAMRTGCDVNTVNRLKE